MSAVGFKPSTTYILVAVPKEAYVLSSGLEVDEKLLEEKRKEWIQKGGHLLVVEKGPQCTDFTEVGDKVLIGGLGGAEKIELDEIDDVFYVIRESSLIGKFD